MFDFILYTSRTADASGLAERRVECEKCRAVFRYELARTVTAEKVAICLIWIGALQERAEAAARAKLERALVAGSDPVPCPACGWVQSAMNADELERQYGWLRKAPYFFAVYALGLGMLVFAVELIFLLDWAERPRFWVFLPPFLPAVLLALHYRKHRRKARVFDLNEMVPEGKRIAEGRQKATLLSSTESHSDPKPWRPIRRANGGGSEK